MAPLFHRRIKYFETRLVAPTTASLTDKGSVVIIRTLPGGITEEVRGSTLDLATELQPGDVKKEQEKFQAKVWTSNNPFTPQPHADKSFHPR